MTLNPHCCGHLTIVCRHPEPQHNAVVGVVLNLAVWFSLHTVFGTVNEASTFGVRLLVPSWSTVDVAALLIALGAFIAMFRFKTNMLITLGGRAAIGLLFHLLFRT